jgi:hypothetical protein
VSDDRDDPFLPPTAFLKEAEERKQQRFPEGMPPELRKILEAIVASGGEVQAVPMGDPINQFSHGIEITTRHSKDDHRKHPIYKRASEMLSELTNADLDSEDEAAKLLTVSGMEKEVRQSVFEDAAHMAKSLVESVFNEKAATRLIEETCLAEEICTNALGFFVLGMFLERVRNDQQPTAGPDQQSAEAGDPPAAEAG